MGQNKWDASRARSRSLLNGLATIEDVALLCVSVSQPDGPSGRMPQGSVFEFACEVHRLHPAIVILVVEALHPTTAGFSHGIVKAGPVEIVIINVS